MAGLQLKRGHYRGQQRGIYQLLREGKKETKNDQSKQVFISSIKSSTANKKHTRNQGHISFELFFKTIPVVWYPINLEINGEIVIKTLRIICRTEYKWNRPQQPRNTTIIYLRW